MARKTLGIIGITGASGFLGSELVRHLGDAGWRVVGLVREPSVMPARPGVSYRQYDVSLPPDSGLLQGVDVLVHTAYVPYDAGHPDAMDSNLEGGRLLLANSRRHAVKKNIFISSMSAHDDALSVYGRQKLAVEQLFAGPRDVIIRSGLIIGNGGIVKRMSDFMRTKHVVPLIGGGRQPLQIIAIYDLTAVIAACAARPSLCGRYTVATPRIYSYKEFYQALARSLHARVAFVPVPFGVLQAAFRVAAQLHLPLGVGEDNLLGLKMLRSVDTAADVREIGVSLDELDTVLGRISL